MELIRLNCFETNSSSSHSISITKGSSPVYTTMEHNGTIEIKGGEFGWEYEKTNNALTKATYACIQFMHSQEGLQQVLDIIKEQTMANEVIFLGNDNNSYIDHDSMGILPLDEVREFIFNKNYWLFLGNDNSEAPQHFYDVPTFTEGGVIPVAYNWEFKTDYPELNTKFINYPDAGDIQTHLAVINFLIVGDKDIEVNKDKQFIYDAPAILKANKLYKTGLTQSGTYRSYWDSPVEEDCVILTEYRYKDGRKEMELKYEIVQL